MSIEELRRLEQAATPGPWGTHHRDEFDQLLEFHRALTDVEHIAERASLLALNAREINDG